MVVRRDTWRKHQLDSARPFFGSLFEGTVYDSNDHHTPTHNTGSVDDVRQGSPCGRPEPPVPKPERDLAPDLRPQVRPVPPAIDVEPRTT